MSDRATLIAAEAARKAVLRQLAAAYDHWADVEQEFVGAGDYARAETAHGYAIITLRAYRVEQDNPRPKGLREPGWAS